jgi:pimeloyl-ACP methyl ester carboxylesterase
MKRSIRLKLFGSFLRLVFPAILLVTIAFLVTSILLVHKASEPPRAAYLVTPEKFNGFIRSRVKMSEETWQNKDAAPARGWLLQGASENAPAVVLLHRYGADRSWLLHLGIKLNEQSGFTVLIPDQRGHGENPSVKTTTFGGSEAEDLLSAIQFLREKKVNGKIGVHGVELGAVAAIFGATKEPTVQALALDSIPESSQDVLEAAVKTRSSYAGEFAYQVAAPSASLYHFNAFRSDSTCDAAKNLSSPRVILLTGQDPNPFRESTATVGKCFPNQANVQAKTDLMPSGFNLNNIANSQQAKDYDQIVINFFRENLSN